MDIERIAAITFLETHPEEAVRLLETFPATDTTALLEALAPPLAAHALERMDTLAAAAALAPMRAERAGAVVAHLPAENAALLLRRLDPPQRAALLENTAPDARERLRAVLDYPEGTAGALMDPAVFVLPADQTVEEALNGLRKHAPFLARYLYVVNREKRLVGVLNYRELHMAARQAPVASVMQDEVEALPVYTDWRALLVHPAWRRYAALPVVEDGGRFVGILRQKTLRRLQEKADRKASAGVNTAGAALGELYQIGLTGLVRSALPPQES